MDKIFGNIFLGYVGGWVFHIYPRLHLIMGPLIPFRIFVDHVTIFSLNPGQHLRCSSFWQKEKVIAGNFCYVEDCFRAQINLDESNKVFHPPFPYSKSAKKNKKPQS